MEGEPVDHIALDLLGNPVLYPSELRVRFEFFQVVQVVEIVPNAMFKL